jgi:hypothetical protein
MLGYLPHCLKTRGGFWIEIEINDMPVHRRVKNFYGVYCCINFYTLVTDSISEYCKLIIIIQI